MCNELAGKKVLVVGSGLSGMGAVKLLGQIGAVPILYDSNDKLTENELKGKLPAGVAAEIILGELPEEVLAQITAAIISPGVPMEAAPVVKIREGRIPIWGEIELGFACAKGSVVAITGTNGKTTTTTLVGEIMKAFFPSVFVVGNIGRPYTEVALETGEETVTIAEISSFQLETVTTFAPKVSAILNITPDHLDRHKTMECYVKMKERVAGNQTSEDVCVLNYENEYTRDFGKRCPARVIYFSSARPLENGYFLKDEHIYFAKDQKEQCLMNIHEMNLVGICNVENVMAAIAICHSCQVPMELILDTVRKFRAVEHRIEYVATRGGVDYYNDSKGTNPDAAIQGIKAMSKPTVLLGGGYDKGSDYDEWIGAFDNKVKAFVLVGATREKIARCAAEQGISNVILADTFEEALDRCREQAEPGDAVLLSPACASWGMFPNYEVRGNCFKEYVLALEE